jgi:hypothetical protein
MKPRQCTLALLATVVLSTSFMLGQETKRPISTENRAEVPELTKFHDVIYKIWHNAWPAKDVTMLRELLPDVEQQGKELITAALPGILREKKSSWDKNIAILKTQIAEYRHAAEGKDDDKLLKVAEALHSQYEVLVRVVRPPLKELDEFHSLLYLLYHYYLPEWELAKIKSSVEDLKAKFSVLNTVALPARLKDRKELFEGARAKLGESLAALEISLDSKDRKVIETRIEALHSRYEDLSKILE